MSLQGPKLSAAGFRSAIMNAATEAIKNMPPEAVDARVRSMLDDVEELKTQLVTSLTSLGAATDIECAYVSLVKKGGCKKEADPVCGQGYCADHCSEWCQVECGQACGGS